LYEQSWPPHVYIAIEALKNLPNNLAKGPLPKVTSNVTSFDLIPAGQLGLSKDEVPRYGLPTLFSSFDSLLFDL
jgi:alpha,alpha-trehalase